MFFLLIGIYPRGVPGFVTMAYLFFGNFLVRYSTPFQTQQSLFNMLLGKFSFQELIQVDPNLGAIFFMSYSNCMMLITMNIFVVILDSSVGDVNEGTSLLSLLYFLKQTLHVMLYLGLDTDIDGFWMKLIRNLWFLFICFRL